MEIPHIEVDELAAVHASGVPIVDVRMPDEYVAAHVPGATLVPLPEVPDAIDSFPSDRTVYIVCRSGGRSLRACEFLRAHGVDAVNVAGGILAWMDAGHDVATGTEPR